MAVPANKAVRFTVQGSTGEWVPRTPDDVRSTAISELSQYGVTQSLSVVKESSRLPISTIDLWDWRYTANLVLVTKYSHASIADLDAIVRAAFWSATGEPPTVTSPDYGEVQGSGVTDNSPDLTNKLLGTSAITIVAAVAVAVFVLKRG